MTNVYIPFHLLTNVRVKVLKEGQWIKGEYVEEKSVEKIIKAVYMPLSLNELKNYPQGALTLEDMDFRTKENLNLGDIVIINEVEWKIIQKADYSYIADLKFYILRRSDKDD
ncbi:hypothetical protein [uncultured Fusobacterium sp.]|uniref:hypothetical protein n=1 Tax=uncultured Fusobacterium sp. TaxID=159267 RepID=UPI0025ECC4FA|nr:hypothetical protein [uncultured Fusobacterium sp.]